MFGKREALVATEGDEVKLAGLLAAFEADGHGLNFIGWDEKRFAHSANAHSWLHHEWGTQRTQRPAQLVRWYIPPNDEEGCDEHIKQDDHARKREATPCYLFALQV